MYQVILLLLLITRYITLIIDYSSLLLDLILISCCVIRGKAEALKTTGSALASCAVVIAPSICASCLVPRSSKHEPTNVDFAGPYPRM